MAKPRPLPLPGRESLPSGSDPSVETAAAVRVRGGTSPDKALPLPVDLRPATSLPARGEASGLVLPSRPASQALHTNRREESSEPRRDHLLVAGMVEPGSRVLDVGCGDGSLLALLREKRQVDGRGIELSREGVNECLAKGLPVIQGDADADLADYPADSFDYVILSQTLQATRQPRVVLEHLLRIGRRAIVSFPNFGHWRVRWEIAARGRMPVTGNMPYSWYDTPNIHFCTIKDFVGLCREIDACMERAVALDASGQPVRVNLPWWAWNLFGEQAVFLLQRGDTVNGSRRAPRTGLKQDSSDQA